MHVSDYVDKIPQHSRAVTNIGRTVMGGNDARCGFGQTFENRVGFGGIRQAIPGWRGMLGSESSSYRPEYVCVSERRDIASLEQQV